ncbi:YmaF family protein [Lentibacillus jeotgali]|uniref:YmaF family protein n=1 Tax=Lentibacillus jeotgali TaxID=558169 RepID=UPI000262585A|nr:YmaF family protein [Lentibacillus jeotgali]
MRYPVQGYMTQPIHLHSQYDNDWNHQTHVHPFIGVTDTVEGHQHKYVGLTEPAPSGIQHFHDYLTWTFFVDGHRHVLYGKTGPAIPVEGGHIHHFEGYTIGYTYHQHWYNGSTQIVAV